MQPAGIKSTAISAMTDGVRSALLACCAVLATGCAWEPVPPAAPAPVAVPPAWGPASGADNASQTAARVAQTAHSMVGVPYRWGGTTPAGFDCSGLVHYAYAAHGVAVPRTAAQLLAASRPVTLAAARPGDLVFFRTAAKGGHVGILLDQQRFVHAPSSGKRVAVGDLSRPWYRDRLIRTGRIAAPTPTAAARHRPPDGPGSASLAGDRP